MGFYRADGGWTRDGTNVRLTTATDRVGIGTATPADTLDVAGNVVVRDGDRLTFGGAMFTARNLGSIAVNGVASLAAFGVNTPYALIMVIDDSGPGAAMYLLQGGGNTTTEIFDPSATFSPTAGTASSWNIYYSAANARYEIENKRPGAEAPRVFYFRRT